MLSRLGSYYYIVLAMVIIVIDDNDDHYSKHMMDMMNYIHTGIQVESSGYNQTSELAI